jgi:hypothetical protein
MDNDGGNQLFKGDDGNALRFYYTAPRNNFQSEKTGQPCFDKALMVDVITPGASESSPTFELEREYCKEAGIDATRSDKYTLYETQINAFKRGNGEGAIDGMPLKSWAQIDVAQVAALNARHIYTVEQLSAVSDGNLDKLGLGGRMLRDQALAYLNSREFGVPTAQLQASNSALQVENERLQAQVLELSARLAVQPPVTPPAPPTLDAPAPVFDMSGLGTAPPAPDLTGLGTVPAAPAVI